MILVVEENEDVCRATEFLLKAEGHEVKCFDSGTAALIALAEMRPMPDCVVVSSHLPDRDGHDVLGTICRVFQGVPVVVFTAGYDDRQMSEAMKRGATGWASRTDSNRLLEVIAEVTGRPVKHLVPQEQSDGAGGESTTPE